MLAEHTFSTEFVLPQSLKNAAIVLAGELSWPTPEALRVVEWLEANGREVAGVELWREKEGKPLFVAASNYSPPAHSQVTLDSVAWCAHRAKLFIAKFGSDKDNLFNLSW